MIALTVPLLFAPITAFRFDAVWFGVILVLFLEVRILTPPFGINLFVMQCVSKWPLGHIACGAMPYCFIIFGFVALVAVFPEIVTWPPTLGR